MKSKLNITFLFIFLVAVIVLAKEKPLESKAIDLIIIRDTSWSTDQYLSDFSSLSRQGVSSLQLGDYLEVITAEAGKPKLRIAQSIKSGSAQEIQNIHTILKSIRCPFLSDARLDDALEMAVKRLNGAGSQESDRESIIIVLTNGQLHNNEAKKICQLATELRKRSCQLYLTGTSATNKRILVAASQGLFNWSLISQANPSFWIQKLRKMTAIREEEQSLTQPAFKNKDAETAKAKFAFQGQIEGPISVLPPEEKLPSEPVIEEQQVPQEAEQPAVEITEPLEQEQPEETELLLPPSELKPRKALSKYLWWILLSVAALLTIFAVAWFVAAKKANPWKAKVSSLLKTIRPQNPGTLIAKVNGQTYRLGPINHLNAIHAGRNLKNTIKITDNSIEGRHLKIYRKRNNLMLRNLARTPVMVNGIEVKSRHKLRLVLPSVIRLNDKIKLNLALSKPGVNSTERSIEDEQEKQ